MNCVNYVKKTVCMVLMLAFVLISCLGAFATSENPKKLGILASSIKITDTKVEYLEIQMRNQLLHMLFERITTRFHWLEKR